MITIKAFKKDEEGRLYCQPDKERFYYEVGKTYEMPAEKVKICKSGFHAAADCDISNTLDYYDIYSHYCLVDIDVIDNEEDKVVGNKITLLKELSFEECITYDKTGRWCYEFARDVKGANVELLQQAVIEKDKTGKICLYFAEDIDGADVALLHKAVIDKDKTGEICLEFARDVEGADIELLQQAIIEKDPTGDICLYFADVISDADILLLQQAVIEKDKTGKICLYFAEDIDGADVELLKKISKERSEKYENY